MMENTKLIKALRTCADHNAVGDKCYGECPYNGNYNECVDQMILDAANALESDEKQIAELEAQMLKIKSRIYDLESMAKREYDDDSDNEYLEGYFDGLHQAAKLISTMPTIEREKQ